MTPELPNTCVIGAGVSGLTAVKALGDWGVPHTCFEASDDVGGNWYFQNPNGRSSAYRSLHIDTSKNAISFADFPMDGRYPDFPHHSEIKQFLDEYAERFGLRDRIRFGTRVEYAERLADGGWRIRTSGPEGQGEERLDALLVCNGHHWDPSFPDFPGHFDGETIHSHHYIDPNDPLDLVGKRVLVVGIGNSAVDITSELLLRLGSGDAVAKPDVAELLGDRVRFTDGSVEEVDAIVFATGYRISFPFFDPEFISAPGNVLPLYKRMFKPEVDDLAFIGLGQAIPTIFPFAECQSKLAGRWLGGDWAPPSPAEMEHEIREDERRFVRHYSNRPRHTMQLDYYVYEHELRKRVIPEGQARARAGLGAGARPVGSAPRPDAAEDPQIATNR